MSSDEQVSSDQVSKIDAAVARRLGVVCGPPCRRNVSESKIPFRSKSDE